MTSPATVTEVMRRFHLPNAAQVPTVFNSLDARDKYEVLAAAHRATTKAKVPARSTTPPPATTNRSVQTTRGPSRPALPADGDPVAAAIAFMAKE
jgi:hypothetical protein